MAEESQQSKEAASSTIRTKHMRRIIKPKNTQIDLQKFSNDINTFLRQELKQFIKPIKQNAITHYQRAICDFVCQSAGITCQENNGRDRKVDFQEVPEAARIKAPLYACTRTSNSDMHPTV